MKLNLVTLKGVKEIELILVDNSIFNWVTAPVKLVPSRKVFSGPDAYCPKTVAQRIANAQAVEDYIEMSEVSTFVPVVSTLRLSDGQNDRAALAQWVPAEVEGQPSPKFYSILDLLKYIKKHDITVTRSYEGYIY